MVSDAVKAKGTAMPGLDQDFAVQSFCFRTIKDNAQVAQAVKQIGLFKIELCRAHCDFMDESQHEPTIQTYADAGVSIVAIGVEGFNGSESDDRKRFEFARKCGANRVHANFNPETFERAWPVVHKLAEEYDIPVGIHNHGGYHWLGSKQMLEHVFKQVGPRIGLCMDTAWTLDAAGDPVQWVETFADRLVSLHLKDFIFHRDRKREDIAVGQGNINLPKLVAALRGINFQGVATLEYEGDPENPVPTLSTCVESIRAAL
jgi:sugar phosphate isomerase/epimerase